MQRHEVDGISFDFNDDWLVAKYDDWAFYRNQFSRYVSVKALDLLVLSSARTAYLIEVKDYRMHQRTKASDLSDEVTDKVLDTLAALLPAKVNAASLKEKALARKMLAATRLRVVLHLEQPVRHSKLFRRAIDPADIQQKLKRSLRAVDPHPIVSESARMGTLGWIVH